MTAPVTGVPPEFEELPEALMDYVDDACGGDWRRVTRDGPLAVMIHNTPQTRVTYLPPTRATSRHFGRGASPRVIAPERSLAPITDEEPMSLARRLADLFPTGLPDDLEVEVSPDVDNLSGGLRELGLGAVRAPRSVSPDWQSVDSGYAIVGFYSGDTKAVVGFRDIARPYLMAVIVTGVTM